MAYAGRKCKVRVTGSPLTLTDEATTTSDSLTFQITDENKRILAPDSEITVKDNGVAVTSGYTINRLDGSVKFDATKTGPVTISGSYLPALDVAEAYEFSYSIEADNLDATRFQDEYVRRKQGQIDFSSELSAWHDVNVDVFTDALLNNKIMVLEFYVNNSLDLRAWVLTASDEIESAADSLVEEGIEFEGTTDKEGRAVASYEI
jgi:hypothetical protein